jgi:LPS export ABC transporter protein LptC/lipopolysaccharide transport protein LptA
MKNKNAIIIILLLLLAIVFAWAIFAPEENISKKVSQTIEEQKKKFDFFMKGVTFSEIVNGIKYWEIKSISSQINKNTGIATLKDIQGTFFKNGRPSFSFTAPQVLWSMNSKKIKIDSPTGFGSKFKLKTAVLDWSLSSKKISTESIVTVEADNLLIVAKGLFADIGLEKMVLKGHPTARPDRIGAKGEGEGLYLEADIFEINGLTGAVVAKGNAYATKGGLHIKSKELFFDRRQDILFAKGDARISFKDISAQANLATYEIKKYYVVLSGSARASRGGSSLAGNKLKIDLKNNRMSIEGKTTIIIPDEFISEEVKGHNK